MDIAGNTVSGDAIYTNADGIQVAGRVRIDPKMAGQTS